MQTLARALAAATLGATLAVPVRASEPEMALRSCVPGSPPLVVPARSARAALDDADRAHFHGAAATRYPLYQRGGFVPPAVLLLQRNNQWQYVTLWHDGGAAPCFTAVFAAERFDFTERWLAKYRPREADLAD